MTIQDQHKHQLKASWGEFQSVNDQRLNEVERKGSADPLTVQHLHRINEALDHYQERLNRVETVLDRPQTGGEASVYTKSHGYQDAFRNYLTKGADHQLAQWEKKSLSASNEADGGYLIAPQMVHQVVKRLDQLSPMRLLASIQAITTSSLDVIEDRDEMVAGWTGETDAVQDTETAKFVKRSIPVHEIYAQPKATQKLIDDASINIEAWLEEKLVESFARTESKAFIHGNGQGKPRGILSYEHGNEWGKINQLKTDVEGEVTADSLFHFQLELSEIYAARASFLMHRTVLGAIRGLKDPESGRYLWQPSFTAGLPDTLLGMPVVQCADMPLLQKGALAIALADFKAAYQIADRTDMRILRDPYTDKPFVKFYSTKRVGGDVKQFNAIKLLRIAGE